MTIAGSDSGGGAGIQADILTFTSIGIYATSAITCLTAQNPAGVSAVQALESKLVRAQIDQVMDFFPVRAIKTGMLFNSTIIDSVAEFLSANPEIPAVVDPVMVASSGALLLERSAVESIKKNLLPKAFVITPNLDECEVLLGNKPMDCSGMVEAAEKLQTKYGCQVLLKGGHLSSDTIVDILCDRNGNSTILKTNRIPDVDTHGSGCTLSSAITAFLAKEYTLKEACHLAHAYLQNGMKNPIKIGEKSFIAHL